MFAELAAVVATSAAAATGLRATQLHNRLHTDPLTRLPNRAALTRAFARVQRGARRGELAGVLLCDVDRFKPINDVHGHRFGDQVIQRIAGDLAALAEPGELAVRLQGDEFAVLLPGLAKARDAEARARTYRTGLATTRLIGGHRLDISVSVGSATGTAMATTLAALLAHADEHMYQNKTATRLTALPAKPIAPRLRDNRKEAA